MQAKHLRRVNEFQVIDVIHELLNVVAFWDCVAFVEVKTPAKHRLTEPHLHKIKNKNLLMISWKFVED